MTASADWQHGYQHPVRWDVPIASRPVPELLFETAARMPGAPAIDFLGRSYSYAEIADAVRRAARGFQILGVRRGIKVGRRRRGS